MASEDIVIRLREQSDDDSSPETLCQYAAEEIEILRSQVLRWIPVGQRLPEQGVMVLGYDKQDGVTLTINVGVGRSGQRIWFGCSPNAGEYEDAQRYSDPTHWMPLPQVPQEGK
jgi:hypothetical protein